LDAGLGALVLFGCVQLTMFIAAIAQGEVLSMRRLLGGAVAFGGLVLLLAPMGAGAAISLPHAAAMAAAGIGWGVYSLLGRGAPDPLAATATNFAGAAVLGMGASLGLALWQGLPMPPPAGVALAVLSGAVTSGLGYAVWYQILPQLRASTAAIAQLTVPVIAVLAGVLLLGEALSAQALLAAAVVLSGVLLSLSGARRS
jgi:drug/metabolite transporter (DMT)-like permease